MAEPENRYDDPLIDTNSSGIANEGVVFAESDGRSLEEQFDTLDDSPLEEAQQSQAEAEIYSAQQKLLAQLAEIESEIANLPAEAYEEREKANAAKTSISSTLAQLSNANRTGLGATAALATAGLVYNRTSSIGSAAAINTAQAEKDYYTQSLSEAERQSFDITTRNNIAGLGNYNTSAQALLNDNLDPLFEQNPQLRSQMAAYDLFSNNQTLQNIRNEEIDLNERAKEYLLSRPELQDNDRLRNALGRAEALNDRNARANQDYWVDELADKYRRGEITEEQLTTMVEQQVAERETKLQEITQNTVDLLKTDQERAVLANMVREHFNLPAGTEPSNEQVQQFLNEVEPDPKHVNDAAYVLREHQNDPDGGWQYLTDEQKQAWVAAQARLNSEVQQIGYDVQELLQNVSPEKRQEILAAVEQAARSGDPAALEGALGVISAATDGHGLDEATVERIRKVAEVNPTLAGQLLSNAVNNNQQGILNSWVQAENFSQLTTEQRAEVSNLSTEEQQQLWSKNQNTAYLNMFTTDKFELTDYDWSAIESGKLSFLSAKESQALSEALSTPAQENQTQATFAPASPDFAAMLQNANFSTANTNIRIADAPVVSGDFPPPLTTPAIADLPRQQAAMSM